MRHATPYTVIGGFLGAGKTTLLNNLLPAVSDRRLAVLVNDFGEINIDVELIDTHDGETIKLANGCICCSLAHGFANALAALDNSPAPFDHVIVEASGVSDPLRVGDLGVRTELALDGIVVVADAAQLCTLAQNVYVGELILSQLQAADLLILNKIDLVSPSQLDDVRALLRATVAETPTLETIQGEVSPELLLGLSSERTGEGTPATREGATASPQHDHGATYATWSFTTDSPLAEAKLVAWIEGLPATVLRAKGLLYLADDPTRAFLLQLVGRRWQLTAAEPWGEQAPSSRLLVIGLPQSCSSDGALSVTSPF
jgi:G3E family GTPase